MANRPFRPYLRAMKTNRIHITGASGAGTTTLGRALADRLGIPQHDSDDYFWEPTIPPYRRARPAEDRLRLMQEVFLPRADWILSGSVAGWMEAVTHHFDLVVFLFTPTEVRLARLRDRETRHFGAEAVGPGGWRQQETVDFLAWAGEYDDATREGRSLALHEAWLKTITCPLLRLEGDRAVEDLVDAVAARLEGATDERL